MSEGYAAYETAEGKEFYEPRRRSQQEEGARQISRAALEGCAIEYALS